MRNFVLVNGAWLGSWVWAKVVTPLRKKDCGVYTVTLTGMGDREHLARPDFGIETAVQDVVNTIEYEDLKDVILVGHSFAGKVVAAVQDRIPERIRMLLFLDAMVPAKARGQQCGIDDFPDKESDDTKDAIKNRGNGWRLPLTEEILNQTGKDLQGRDRAWFLSKVTPWPIKLIKDSIKLSEKYDKVKKAFIFCTGGGDDVDSILKSGVDGEYRVIDSGHWPMITKPRELVQAFIELSA